LSPLAAGIRPGPWTFRGSPFHFFAGDFLSWKNFLSCHGIVLPGAETRTPLPVQAGLYNMILVSGPAKLGARQRPAGRAR